MPRMTVNYPNGYKQLRFTITEDFTMSGPALDILEIDSQSMRCLGIDLSVKETRALATFLLAAADKFEKFDKKLAEDMERWATEEGDPRDL